MVINNTPNTMVSTAAALLVLMLPAKATNGVEQLKVRTRLPRSVGQFSEYKRANEADFTCLKSPVDLPNFPAYTGQASFVYGAVMQHAKGGTVYTLSYNVREDQPTVLDWYRAALKINKWSIDESMKSNNCVGAIDPHGNRCQIFTSNPTTTTGHARTQLIVQYRAGKRS